ncbi:DUF402 domain-containing protein [Deinococcus altitudinis]|uniref:DUF402 domain-containing protein n=1 Tax=Deinococcus altitudinis TaxID=468914 RepID=UPI003892631A
MHSVKVSRLDLKAMTHEIGGIGQYPIGRSELTANGLHLARAMPGHPTIAAQEAHLLPALDLVVTHFTPRPGCAAHSQFYIDVAAMEVGPQVWTVRDLYLDVVIEPGGTPRLIDADEYVEAVLEGHLSQGEQRRALLSAERVVNGLFTHGNSLQDWLASLGIHLDWWTPLPGPALHSSS